MLWLFFGGLFGGLVCGFCVGLSSDFRRGFSPWIFPWICPWIFPWIFVVDFSVDFFLLISRFSRLKFFTFFSTAFSTPFFTADFRGGILKRIPSWVFWKFSCRPETRRGLVFPLPPYPAAATLKSCVINHMCIFGQSPAKNCLHQNAFVSKKPPRATTYVKYEWRYYNDKYRWHWTRVRAYCRAFDPYACPRLGKHTDEQ